MTTIILNPNYPGKRAYQYIVNPIVYEESNTVDIGFKIIADNKENEMIDIYTTFPGITHTTEL